MLNACEVIKDMKPDEWIKGRYCDGKGNMCALGFLASKAGGTWGGNILFDKFNHAMAPFAFIANRYDIGTWDAVQEIGEYNDQPNTTLEDVKEFICNLTGS